MAGHSDHPMHAQAPLRQGFSLAYPTRATHFSVIVGASFGSLPRRSPQADKVLTSILFTHRCWKIAGE
jgi:hypothetical protein